MEVMLERNEAYLRREAEIEAQWYDQPLRLRMELTNDYQLNRASGAAKTCAALIAALAAAISSEIAYREHIEKNQPGSRLRGS